MQEILITSEPIELYKILKMQNLASSGGEAKVFIAEGLVRVNGEIEDRKRKKIGSGDVITVSGEKYVVRLSLKADREGTR